MRPTNAAFTSSSTPTAAPDPGPDMENPHLYAKHYHHACLHLCHSPTTLPTITGPDHPPQIVLAITTDDVPVLLIQYPRWCSVCVASRTKVLEELSARRTRDIEKHPDVLNEEAGTKAKSYLEGIFHGRIRALGLPLEVVTPEEEWEDVRSETQTSGVDAMETQTEGGDAMEIDSEEKPAEIVNAEPEDSWNVSELITTVGSLYNKIQAEDAANEDIEDFCVRLEGQRIEDELDKAFREWFEEQALWEEGEKYGIGVQGKLESEAMAEEDIDARDILMMDALL